LISTGVTAGSYTTTSITVDADGRITAASSGAAATSAGMGIPTLYAAGPTSGTYTATPTASRLGVYMYAGGGGGGTSYQTMEGGVVGAGGGGGGGFGFYNKPIAQPFSQPYAVGAAGNAPSGSGGATNFTNVGSVNGGGGGNPSPGGAPGNTGSAGTTPGASFTYPTRDFIVGGGFGNGGGTGPYLGSPGAAGVLVIFENTGT